MCLTQIGLAPDGKPFNLIQLTNSQGMCVRLMDWGATWLSCQVPVAGSLREVLLGCQVQDYPHQRAYLGASIGRYGNRIAYSEFRLNGQQIRLSANQGQHQLHGGQGFDQRRWTLEKSGRNFASFSLFSPDGDQGFTGNLQVSVDYQLDENNTLRIRYQAHCDQATALNLTNHAYFNLCDAEQGIDVRHSHYLQINGDFYLPVDKQGIPNAGLKLVSGTSFDFRQGKLIGQDFLQGDQIPTKGYDHSFLLANNLQPPQIYLKAVDHSLTLAISTNQSAVQLYSGNYLANTPNRWGGIYQDYAGIALETQCLPDSPNHPEWQHWGGIVQAHQTYENWTTFQFSAN